MSESDAVNRLVVLAIGILVLLTPALLLATVFWFLTFTGDLVLREVTLLEFVELYLIELVLIAAVTYSLYRLVLWLAEHKLPDALDTLDEDVGGTGRDSSDDRD